MLDEFASKPFVGIFIWEGCIKITRTIGMKGENKIDRTIKIQVDGIPAVHCFLIFHTWETSSSAGSNIISCACLLHICYCKQELSSLTKRLESLFSVTLLPPAVVRRQPDKSSPSLVLMCCAQLTSPRQEEGCSAFNWRLDKNRRWLCSLCGNSCVQALRFWL